MSRAKHLEITLSICVIHFEDVASSQSFELHVPCLIKAIFALFNNNLYPYLINLIFISTARLD